MDVAQQLRAYREATKLTQEQFGRRVGVTRYTVNRWERGERRIDLDLVTRVSEVTGIPKAQLRPDLAELVGVRQ